MDYGGTKLSYVYICAFIEILILVIFLAEHSKKSNKAATIEMYAPSSFNETVTGGETLSSVSEKSENLSPIGSRHEHLVGFLIQGAKVYFTLKQNNENRSYCFQDIPILIIAKKGMKKMLFL